MTYSIRTLDRITPRYLTRTGPGGSLVQRENLGTPVPKPDTFGKRIYSPLEADTSLIYEADPVGRTELWEDTAGTVTLAEVDAACPGFRLWREKAIRRDGEKHLNAIASPYSPAERETWPYQREECIAYSRDNAALTPFCDAIASQRGIPRALFLSKVKENMDLFSVVSAAILGIQQALIDQIYAAGSIEEILSIKWP